MREFRPTAEEVKNMPIETVKWGLANNKRGVALGCWKEP